MPMLSGCKLCTITVLIIITILVDESTLLAHSKRIKAQSGGFLSGVCVLTVVPVWFSIGSLASRVSLGLQVTLNQP